MSSGIALPTVLRVYDHFALLHGKRANYTKFLERMSKVDLRTFASVVQYIAKRVQHGELISASPRVRRAVTRNRSTFIPLCREITRLRGHQKLVKFITANEHFVRKIALIICSVIKKK